MALAIASKLPLKFGMTGPAVKEAQAALALRGYPLMGTGSFLGKTRDAVKTYQTVRGLKPTGIIDLATARSLDMTTPTPVVNANALPWVTTAIQSIGIAEVKGNGDNPVILAMAKRCGGNIAKNYKHDATAWCQLFVQWTLAVNDIPHLDTLWALDSAKLGTSLGKKGYAVGAIASKKRTGGGHTFIIIGKTKDGLIVGVGGNQGDRVSRATFHPDEIVSCNWPDAPGYPPPSKTGISTLPVVESAPLSKHEA